MRGCGPGEIRTHDLRGASLVLYPAELRGRYLFRPAGIKLFRNPVRRTPPQIPPDSGKVRGSKDVTGDHCQYGGFQNGKGGAPGSA